jgi:4'-phosphopantetheinyl transferase
MDDPDPSLRDAEAHVWYAWTNRCCTDASSAYYRSLLNAEEAGQLERFAFEHLRREYLVTRALCRLTLSRYGNVDPRDWVFARNRYGRPEIVAPRPVPRLRFNLSNARSLVACVVTLDADAGVDVEEVDRPGITVDIADSFFSIAELTALRALPPRDQRWRFFQLWTLKEAYIKARGMGLAIPLGQFSFAIDGSMLAVSFDPALDDDPESWQFALHELSDRHIMAVGIRNGRTAPFALTLRETTLPPYESKSFPAEPSPLDGSPGALLHVATA